MNEKIQQSGNWWRDPDTHTHPEAIAPKAKQSNEKKF